MSWVPLRSNKFAEEVATPTAEVLVSELQKTVSRQAREQAMQKILSAAGLAAGVGVAGRGLAGLGQQMSRIFRRPSTVLQGLPQRRILEVPVEYQEEEGKSAEEVPEVRGLLPGGQAGKWYGVPWAIPGLAAVTAGGLYGGWRLTDKVLDKRRKQELASQLEQARKEYREALLGKQATELGSALDELYKTANDTLGAAIGLYGTAAGSASLLGFLAAYNWAKKRQQLKLLEDAQRQRRIEQQRSQPLTLQAVPVGVPKKQERTSSATHAAPELAF